MKTARDRFLTPLLILQWITASLQQKRHQLSSVEHKISIAQWGVVQKCGCSVAAWWFSPFCSIRSMQVASQVHKLPQMDPQQCPRCSTRMQCKTSTSVEVSCKQQHVCIIILIWPVISSNTAQQHAATLACRLTIFKEGGYLSTTIRSLLQQAPSLCRVSSHAYCIRLRKTFPGRSSDVELSHVAAA